MLKFFTPKKMTPDASGANSSDNYRNDQITNIIDT